jgi:hypothetical protein
MKVTPKTIRGIYHLGSTVRLSKAFTEEIIKAVKYESARGERFLVSKNDMILNYAISNL